MNFLVFDSQWGVITLYATRAEARTFIREALNTSGGSDTRFRLFAIRQEVPLSITRQVTVDAGTDTQAAI